VADLASEEEPCASASLHVAVNSKARVVGMTKSGSSGLDPSLTQVRHAGGNRRRGNRREPCVQQLQQAMY
jgi:exosome complex RNA-binding protein Rrp42 (RNase PH superfamily)